MILDTRHVLFMLLLHEQLPLKQKAQAYRRRLRLRHLLRGAHYLFRSHPPSVSWAQAAASVH